MKQSNKRTIIFVICSLLLLIGGLTLAIRLGSVHITFSDIWNSIFNYNETASHLKKYFALLFPTYFHGEGFAGCLIDAFFAGIPVIATDWLYNKDIINNSFISHYILILLNNFIELFLILIRYDTI